MRIRLEMDIPAWKQDYLDADLRFFQAETKFKLCETMEKLRGNHSMRWKIMRVLSKTSPGSNLTIDSFLYGLEAIKEYQVFSYEINHRKGHSTAILDVNEYYFKLVSMLPVPFIQKLVTRKSLLKRLEKETRKTYDRNAKIEVTDGHENR